MEFALCINSVTHKRFLLLELLLELSDELYLLVSSTKNTSLSRFVFFDELCLFLYNSDLNHPADPVV
jgi:hypothetical protein